MAKPVHLPVVSPAEPLRADERTVRPAWESHQAPLGSAAAVSDRQILALVTAADRLRRRQRGHCADVSTTAAGQRLLHLDWAVRAGRLLLADRAAAQAAPTSAARTAPLRRGDP